MTAAQASGAATALDRVGHLLGPLLCIAVAGCGLQSEAHVTRADSAGVEIVTNAGTSKRLGWQADTILVFGGNEQGPAGFYRVRQALVDVDATGKILVLDPSEHRVAVFDDQGRPVQVMGREGGGPGEFQWPIAVAATEDGEVSVQDAGKGTLVWFQASGEPLPEQPFAFTIINLNERQFDVTPSGVAAWARDPLGGTDERRDRLLLIGDADTLTLARRSSFRAMASYPRCGMRFSTSVPLSPRIRWSQWGDRIAVAAWGDDRIDIFDGGRWTRSIRVGGGGREVDEGEAIRMLEARGYHGPCNSTAEELVRKIGFYRQVQRTRALAVGPSGDIWVRREDDHGAARIHILDATGAESGELPTGFPMPLTFLPDGQLVIAIRDSLDVERIGIVRTRR